MRAWAISAQVETEMQKFVANSSFAFLRICGLLLAFGAGSNAFVNAQTAPLAPAAATAPSATPPAAPADPLELGRETPRGTVIGFIRAAQDRKSTRLNSSHANISYAVFCLKKKRTDSRDLLRSRS